LAESGRPLRPRRPPTQPPLFKARNSIAALSKTRSNPIKNSKSAKTLPPPPYVACAGTSDQRWSAPRKRAAVPFIPATSQAASYAAEQNYWHKHDDNGW